MKHRLQGTVIFLFVTVAPHAHFYLLCAASSWTSVLLTMCWRLQHERSHTTWMFRQNAHAGLLLWMVLSRLFATD